MTKEASNTKDPAGTEKKVPVTKTATRDPAFHPFDKPPTQDGPRRVTKAAPATIRKNPPVVTDSVQKNSAPASPPTSAVATAAAAAAVPAPPPEASAAGPVSDYPQPNPLKLLNVNQSDMTIPDLTTETGERRTEAASSAFDFRTDTQSSGVMLDADSESALLSFEVDNEEDSEPKLLVAASVVEAAQPQEAYSAKEGKKAPPKQDGAPQQLQPLKEQQQLQKEQQKHQQQEEQLQRPKRGKITVMVRKDTNSGMKDEKEKVAATALATDSSPSASKAKLYSDMDSSCSENVTPRSSTEVDNSSSSPLAVSAALPLEPPVKMLLPKQSNATRLAQEYRVGDMAPVLVKGCKYVFDNRNMRWKTYDITVRILHPNRGVDQDNYFAMFSAELLDPIKAAAPMFAKVYRRNIMDVAEADYFSLGQAQALCEEFARDYTRQNARPGYPKYRLPLLTNRVVVRLNMASVLDPGVRNGRKGFFSYRTQDTNQMMFFMEPNTIACEAVGASFTSAEVDDGNCYPHGDPAWPRTVYCDIADGFSHFSFVQSRGKMMVHGFLRSNGYLLDPLFHTTDRDGFRMGDGGKKAIDQWMKQHRCGDTCRALGIRSFREDTVDVSAAAAFNPLANQENYYTEYLRCVRQMRVVVRIALETPDFVDDAMDYDFESVTPASESVASATDIVHAVPVADSSFPVTLNAIKYVFLPARAKWEEVPMKMTVLTPNKPEIADERNAVFAIEEIHEGMQSIPMRAKFILRPGAKDSDYYDVGDAYCVCVALGQVFRGYRKNCVLKRELEFRSAYAVRVPQSEVPESIKAHMCENNFFTHTTADSGDVMFILEPEFISDAPRRSPGAGGMQKDAEGFNDLELRQVVDAFSHFTLHKSGNHLLVCHLKCRDGLLTRPHIDTSNGRGFDTINDGERGIRHWVKHHKCNPLCEQLGMEPLPPRLKLYNISNSKFMTYINLVQQHALREDEKVDFSLPSRHPSEMVSRYVSEQHEVRAGPSPQPVDDRKDLPVAPIEQSRNSNDVSATQSMLAVPPMMDEGEPLLRPWVHTGKGAIPNYPPKKNGVLASGPRRPLTQADLTRLQSRGFETKYILPATKYEYDIDTLSWKVRRIFVRVVAPERGIGQGGMRVCFEVADIDPEECEETVMVAKMYRRTIKDVVEKDYFTEVAVQKLSSLFAEDFNAEKKEGCDVQLSVLGVAVIAIERADLNPELLAKKTGFFSYRTTDSQRLMFSIESRLVGRFTKYNGNMGEAYPTNESRLSPVAARERTKVFEAVEALSHYSLVKSEGGLLVCDMQGVNNQLTDLEVHTYDGQGLGIGNFGARGIEKFIERHRCTSVCKALNLGLLRDQKFEVTDAVKTNNKFVRIFERSKEIYNMP